jgi:hypothetical protein
MNNVILILTKLMDVLSVHIVVGGGKTVKLSLCLIKQNAMKTRGEVEVYLHAFLIFTPMEM